MSKHVDLSATPIVETTVEQVTEEMVLSEEEATLIRKANIQAQERIQRLSENVRFLVETNNKLKTANEAFARNAGDFAAHILRLEREIEQLTTPVVTEENVRETLQAYETSYVSQYFQKSQEFSEFFGKGQTPEHFKSAAMALASEAAEMNECLDTRDSMAHDFESLKEEMGDFVWTIAMCCAATGFSLEELVIQSSAEISEHSIPECFNFIQREAGKIVGFARKSSYHGHSSDKSMIWSNLFTIHLYLNHALKQIGWTLAEVMAGNLRKLRERYPSGKFTVAESVSRVDTTL